MYDSRIPTRKKGGRMMLTAVNSSGEVVSLFRSYTRAEAISLKEKGPYFCRECSESLLLKAGTKRIPHFAHHMHSRCPESYENESQYHLNGKIKLYNWLRQKGVSPVMEYYYHEIQQRADIGFIYKEQSFAIEFQCSPISEDLFYKRTQSYLQAGIIPIWIIGANKIKRIDHNRIALTSFNYLFLSLYERKSWEILAFCPNTMHFVFLKNPLPYSTKNTFVNLQIKPLKNLDLSTLLHLSNESSSISFQQWQSVIRKQKDFAAVRNSSFSKAMLAELYNHRISPSQLPSEIGLPVFHSPYISTPPLQWQTFLMMDVIMKKKTFTISDAKTSFYKRVRSKSISVRRFPLLDESEEFRAVEEYFSLLEHLYIISKTDQGGYFVSNKLIFPYSQNEQVQYDQSLNKRFGKYIMKQASQNQFNK